MRPITWRVYQKRERRKRCFLKLFVVEYKEEQKKVPKGQHISGGNVACI